MQRHVTQNQFGRYSDSESFLHRLNPCGKLFIFTATIATGFVVDRVLSLFILGVFLSAHFIFSSISIRHYFKLLYSLRYLFFFTLLVYLLFTPGFTLLGTSWLSRDGLFQGLVICFQMALALGFSILLAITTRPEELAYGLERLCLPLTRFGIPVRLLGQTLALVLYFVDILVSALNRVPADSEKRKSLFQRLESTLRGLACVMDEVLDHADEVALRLSKGQFKEHVPEPRFNHFTRPDWLYVLMSTSLVLVLLGFD